MQDKLKQAQEFRSRAERLHAIARDLPQKAERELLIQLAAEYEDMARSAAAVARAEVSRAVGSDGAGRSDGEDRENRTER